MYQDGSTMLHAIYHVIDVWYNFPPRGELPYEIDGDGRRLA